jgi:uncharacterized protein YrrD
MLFLGYFCAVIGYEGSMETGSYMMIVRGMVVQGTDGDLGTVAEVVADKGVDVFRGIVLAHGFLSTKHGFVPAGKVVSVEQNTLHVSLTKSEAEQLPPPETGGQAFEGRDNLL